VCFIEWLQQILLIAADCINRNGMERIEVVDSGGKVEGGLMEQDVRVAGGTADIETGQLLVIQRCLCPIAFCNYKCFNIGFFPNSTVYTHLYIMNRSKFLHADGDRPIQYSYVYASWDFMRYVSSFRVW
jgi:hypothetical protein